jgi:hypothetical protein
MSALGHKRTFLVNPMVRLTPKKRAFVSPAGHCLSFNNLVGASEHSRWHNEANCSRGLLIGDQLEFRVDVLS